MPKAWYVPIVVFACASPAIDPIAQSSNGGSRPSGSLTRELRVDPIRPLDAVEPVSAIEVRLDPAPDVTVVPYVVEGTVSQVSLNKLADGELTSSLSARVVPTLVWPLVDGWRIRPRVRLVSGQTYSIVSTYGLHGKLSIGTPTNAYLARIWPPVTQTAGSLLGVYCGDNAPLENSEVHLDGSDVRARIVPGLDDEGLRLGRCVRLLWGSLDVDSVQPPPEAFHVAFDPEAVVTRPVAQKVAGVTCTDAEIPFGPGCAQLDAGRIIVRPPPGATLWALGCNGRSHLQAVRNGERFVIPDLGTQPRVQLSVTVFDAAGRSQSSHLEVAMPPPGARIVINEVMANPVGAEPAQEWVELLNAGTCDGDLAAMTLNDSAPGEPLPSLVLHPGDFALLVRDDFDVAMPGDVAPTVPVRWVRLNQLAHGGLSNSGKALSLVDPSGRIVSRFPAIAAKTPGVSAARRTGWALDDDPSAFSPHGGAGASPGEANYFDP